MASVPELFPPVSTERQFLAFPRMLRAVGMATDARKLILAVAGLVLLVVGWRLLDGVFATAEPDVDHLDPGATLRLFELRLDRPWVEAARLVAEPARIVVGPFATLFSPGVGPRLWFAAVARGIWSLVVWGIVGGAIARIALIQATVGGGVGVLTAARFAVARSLALVGAPLTPFLAVALIAAGCAAFGLLSRIPAGVGATIAGVLGFIPLGAGLIMAFILVGLALGWPLMHATVAAEGEDVADALSRSYSYVNQRTPRYLAHLALAWALGVVGLVAVIFFARLVLGLADWGVALGAPARPATIPLAERATAFWTELAAWTVHAYLYSYFWTSTAMIYLILRQDVDGTDVHDVYLPTQADDTFAGPDPTHSPGPDEGSPPVEPVAADQSPA